MIATGCEVIDRHGRRGTVIEVVRDYARVRLEDGEHHWYSCVALTCVALGGLFEVETVDE